MYRPGGNSTLVSHDPSPTRRRVMGDWFQPVKLPANCTSPAAPSSNRNTISRLDFPFPLNLVSLSWREGPGGASAGAAPAEDGKKSPFRY